MSGDKLWKMWESCIKMLWNYFPYGVTVKNTFSLHILNITWKTDFKRQVKPGFPLLSPHLLPILLFKGSHFNFIFFWTLCDVQAHVCLHEIAINWSVFCCVFMSITTSVVGIFCIFFFFWSSHHISSCPGICWSGLGDTAAEWMLKFSLCQIITDSK